MDVAELLADEEIEARLGELEGWAREGDTITKTFDHGDFVGSVEFVRRLTDAGRRRWAITRTSRSRGARSRCRSRTTPPAA